MIQGDIIDFGLEFLAQEYHTSDRRLQSINIKQGACHGLVWLDIAAEWISKQPNPENKKRDDADWLQRMKALLRQWKKDKTSVTAEEKSELFYFLNYAIFAQNPFLISLRINQRRYSQLLKMDDQRCLGPIGSSHYMNTKNSMGKHKYTQVNGFVDNIFAEGHSTGIYYLSFEGHSCNLHRITMADGSVAVRYYDPNGSKKVIEGPDGKIVKVKNSDGTCKIETPVIAKTPKELGHYLMQTASTPNLSGSILHAMEIGNIFGATQELKPAAVYFHNELDPNDPEVIKNRNAYLSIAAEADDVEAINILLADPNVDINKQEPGKEFTPLLKAAAYGQTGALRKLVEKGADVNQISGNNKATALIYAAKMGHYGNVAALLKEKNIDVNYADPITHMTALHYAVSDGHYDVVELLVNHAAIQIDKRGGEKVHTPLEMAAHKGPGFGVIARLLMKHGADSSPAGLKQVPARKLLERAVNEGYTDVVEKLLTRNDLRINWLADNNKTLIYIAAENNHLKVLEILIKKDGSQLDMPVKNGKTALMIAIERRNFDAAKQLFVAGADSKKISKEQGYDWLQYAAGEGDEETIRAILARSDLSSNAQILNQAVRDKAWRIARILLLSGAATNKLFLADIHDWCKQAILANDFDVVSLLAKGLQLRKRSILGESDPTLIETLIEKKQFDMARFLLEGAPDKSEKRLALNRESVLEYIKKLSNPALAAWADHTLLTEDKDLHQALHDVLAGELNARLYAAAKIGDEGSVKVLLREFKDSASFLKTSLDSLNKQENKTALQVALENNHFEIANKLFYCRANIESISEPLVNKWLIHAVEASNAGVIQALLKWQVKPEALNLKIVGFIGILITSPSHRINFSLEAVNKLLTELHTSFKNSSQWQAARATLLQMMLSSIKKDTSLTPETKVTYLEMLAKHPCFSEHRLTITSEFYQKIGRATHSVRQIRTAIAEQQKIIRQAASAPKYSPALSTLFGYAAQRGNFSVKAIVDAQAEPAQQKAKPSV